MVDFNLKEGAPMMDDEISLVLQQIDILFDTVPGEVAGAIGFGTEYDHYMYSFNIDSVAMEEMITDDILSLDLFGYYPEVHVMFLQGTEQDIAIIDITLSKNDKTYKKSYQIS